MADGPASTPPESETLAQLVFESRRFAAALDVERQALADALVTAEERAQDAARHAARAETDAALRDRDRAIEARDAAQAERDRALAAWHDAQAMLGRVTSSTSWRLTAPVRAVMMALLGRERGGQ